MLHVAWDSVQYVPIAGRLRGDERLAHHVEHDLVRYQLTAVEMLLNGSAQLRLPRYVVAEQIARRNVGGVEVGAISAPCLPLPAPGGAIMSTRMVSSRPPPDRDHAAGRRLGHPPGLDCMVKASIIPPTEGAVER